MSFPSARHQRVKATNTEWCGRLLHSIHSFRCYSFCVGYTSNARTARMINLDIIKPEHSPHCMDCLLNCSQLHMHSNDAGKRAATFCSWKVWPSSETSCLHREYPGYPFRAQK